MQRKNIMKNINTFDKIKLIQPTIKNIKNKTIDIITNFGPQNV